MYFVTIHLVDMDKRNWNIDTHGKFPLQGASPSPELVPRGTPLASRNKHLGVERQAQLKSLSCERPLTRGWNLRVLLRRLGRGLGARNGAFPSVPTSSATTSLL